MSDEQSGNLTVLQLKNLIKECLREFEDENQFSETHYKAMWKKQPIVEGFKCG